MNLTDKQFLWLVGGGVLLVVLAGMYARRQAGQVVDAVKEGAKYVNPVDSRNVANTTFEWLHRNLGWGAITGQKEGGIGIWLADVINPPGKWAD